jgi:uncharacterized protein YdcH (DUF465 family)
MSTPSETVREQLLATNDQYRRLKADHSRYDEQLEHLACKGFLTEEEKVQEKTLKKLKLQVKDQMEHLVHRQISS